MSATPRTDALLAKFKPSIADMTPLVQLAQVYQALHDAERELAEAKSEREEYRAALGRIVLARSLVGLSADEVASAVIEDVTYAELQTALVEAAVEVLQRHAPPDGLSDHDALTELYSIFDGPEYRAALAKNPATMNPEPLNKRAVGGGLEMPVWNDVAAPDVKSNEHSTSHYCVHGVPPYIECPRCSPEGGNDALMVAQPLLDLASEAVMDMTDEEIRQSAAEEGVDIATNAKRFRAALGAWAGSGNYIADDDIHPTKVTFANGRTVEIAADGRWLVVGKEEPLQVDRTEKP